MLLKIAEKIIRRNVFEQKKKKPGLIKRYNQAFEQLRPLARRQCLLCWAVHRRLFVFFFSFRQFDERIAHYALRSVLKRGHYGSLCF